MQYNIHKNTFILASLFCSLILLSSYAKNQYASNENYSVIGYEASMLADPKEFQQGEKEFGFRIRYGVDGKNVIDTFTNTYTKDLISKGVAITRMNFSQRELNAILKSMQKIKLFEYPTRFEPQKKEGKLFMNFPTKHYYFKVKYGESIKEIYWNVNTPSSIESANNLRNLINEIDLIIKGKEEYKRLPPPEGGYD